MYGTQKDAMVFESFITTQRRTHSVRYFNGRKYTVHQAFTNFAHVPTFEGASPMVWSQMTLGVWAENRKRTRFTYMPHLPVLAEDNDLRALWSLTFAADGLAAPLDLEPPF